MRGIAAQPAAATAGAGATTGAALTVTKAERAAWRMPSLALLRRPAWSPARWITMVGLRCYVVCAMVLVIVKIVQLAAGH
jgi:hypothetical protein